MCSDLLTICPFPRWSEGGFEVRVDLYTREPKNLLAFQAFIRLWLDRPVRTTALPVVEGEYPEFRVSSLITGKEAKALLLSLPAGQVEIDEGCYLARNSSEAQEWVISIQERSLFTLPFWKNQPRDLWRDFRVNVPKVYLNVRPMGKLLTNLDSKSSKILTKFK